MNGGPERPRLHISMSNRCLRHALELVYLALVLAPVLLLASDGAPSLQRAPGAPLPQGTPGPLPQGTPGVPLPQAVPSRPSALDLRAAASELPQLRSLLVSWRGELIAEHYARGARPSGLANIKSASKSIIAALVGIAIERRLIPGVREPIVSYFPELRTDRDPRKQSITIEDLLTMRSGLGSTSGPNYGAWVQSPQLGPFGAGAANGRRTWRRDGVQHRQLASVVRDSHEGGSRQHVAVRAGSAGATARVHAGALAAGSAGRVLRRKRDAAYAQANGLDRGAVLETRVGQRPPDRPGVVGGHIVRAPDVLRLRFRPPLRLRLVDSAIRGREGLLRVGLWRPGTSSCSATWIWW